MKTTSFTAKETFLSFTLNEQIYAVTVLKVLEVLEVSNLIKIPDAPNYVIGVLNFRDEIVVVLDLKKRLGNEQNTQKKNKTVVIFEIKQADTVVKIGTTVDKVKDVIEIGLNQIKKVPQINEKINTHFITGMAQINEQYIIILDVDKLFNAIDIQTAIEIIANTDINTLKA